MLTAASTTSMGAVAYSLRPIMHALQTVRGRGQLALGGVPDAASHLSASRILAILPTAMVTATPIQQRKKTAEALYQGDLRRESRPTVVNEWTRCTRSTISRKMSDPSRVARSRINAH